jgi:hypothetical protein
MIVSKEKGKRKSRGGPKTAPTRVFKLALTREEGGKQEL